MSFPMSIFELTDEKRLMVVNTYIDGNTMQQEVQFVVFDELDYNKPLVNFKMSSRQAQLLSDAINMATDKPRVEELLNEILDKMPNKDDEGCIYVKHG